MDKLLIIVVQDEDVDALLDAIVEIGERATRVVSAGGFLRRTSAVVLSCVPAHRVSAVLAAVERTCHQRTTIVVPPAVEFGPIGLSAVEVEIGGAIVFVVDVERRLLLATGTSDARSPARTEEAAR